MSAILRLLGVNNPAPIFHSPNPGLSIQSSADDVRENVRNTWGHCNVTDWTEVFFSDCFSQLATLVRSLGLTGGVEKTTVDQLSDWQSKGCQLCMGHAVDKDLLSLVQREVKGIIADLAGHDARLDAVETKLEKEEEARREEIDKILERLVSMEKMVSEELLRRVEGLEQRIEGVEQRVEGAERGLAAAKVKVEEMGQGMAQLQDSFTKTDDKVEQLAHEFKSQRMVDVKPGL
ncbi:uncharacterized protein LOC110050887 [Orbicella faveolata]|uniref:uncharacterized protein LOC110050887 n=1 Tax=Orbicella faveolata TaxID=48498 RepID=UPI0009E35F18|nr:uncharacterized protein LOC110050887 [Orbicella faveolata]